MLRILWTMCGAIRRSNIARNKANSLGILAVIFLALAAPAAADPILLTFSGTITLSTVPAIAGGTSYTGQLLYDAAEPLLACFAVSGGPSCAYGFDAPDDLTL